MRYLEVRRHTMQTKPGEHLSEAGMDRARRADMTMGPFACVITPCRPGAFETAIPMGGVGLEILGVARSHPDHPQSASSCEPLVPLAQALRAQGHAVAFAAPAGFAPGIEAEGFRCFRAGVDEREEEVQERRKQQARRTPAERADFMQTNMFAGTRRAQPARPA